MVSTPGLFRQAAPMIISRAGIAGMAIVDALMVARLGAGELAATTLSDGTFGRIVDIGISGLHAALVLTAAARLPGMAPERLAVWHRASLAGLLAGLLVFALAPLAGTLLALSGQEAALSARAGTVILILAAGLPAGLIALAAAVHLEGIGRAGLVARWMIAANLANAGLNALLIGGIDPIPALGAAGSATATTLVRIALAVALVASVRRIEGPPPSGAPQSPIRNGPPPAGATMSSSPLARSARPAACMRSASGSPSSPAGWGLRRLPPLPPAGC